MKIDIDSILYIVITIVILVISGLGSRRKKKMQQMKTPAAPGSGLFEPGETDEPQAQQEATNPFERFEQILSGQTPKTWTMEEESPETIVDEEELIPEEIKERTQEEETEVWEDKTAKEEIQTEEPEEKTLPGLFENVNEIKRAVIYNEILNRKYF